MNYSTELSHHGILGQKWGVRRFQNKDGTRTAAGKKHEKTLSTEKKEKLIKAAKIAGAVALTAGLAYAAVKLQSNPRVVSSAEKVISGMSKDKVVRDSLDDLTIVSKKTGKPLNDTDASKIVEQALSNKNSSDNSTSKVPKLTLDFVNSKTGEVKSIDPDDFDAFDKIMGNKNFTLTFDNDSRPSENFDTLSKRIDELTSTNEQNLKRLKEMEAETESFLKKHGITYSYVPRSSDTSKLTDSELKTVYPGYSDDTREFLRKHGFI